MMYGDFAYFYDKLMYDLDYEKIYKFIRELLGKKSLEANLILEMACGTGGLTEKLVKDYKVHAFDLSEDMLSVCENKKATNVNTLVGVPTGNGNGNNFNTYDIPTNAKYVGNSNSSKFHRGSCGSVNKIAPNNKVIFNTREEAINSGYQACKRCNP